VRGRQSGAVLVIGRAACQGQPSHLQVACLKMALRCTLLSPRPVLFTDTKRSGRISSSEADSRLASREIPRSLWYPKVNLPKTQIFWDCDVCSLVEAHRRFRRTCIHFQGRYNADIFLKIELSIVTAVSTSSPACSLQCSQKPTTVRVRITLRLAVYGQSVRLSDKPLEDHDQ
jgi:hypothetical protein